MPEMWRGTPPKSDILNLRVGKKEISGRGQGPAMADIPGRAPLVWPELGILRGQECPATRDQNLPSAKRSNGAKKT
jgi:hypothetical protein